MHAVIDPGSTHSYVCTEHLFDKMPSVEQSAYDMHVTSPLGHNVKVNRVYKNCPLVIWLLKFYMERLLFLGHPTVWLQLN